MKRKWLKDYSWMICYNLDGCNYWRSHESCNKVSMKSPLEHLKLRCKSSQSKKRWLKTQNQLQCDKKMKYKVLEWPCQNPDLNHFEMLWVSQARISCLLSWSSSAWTTGSKWIPGGIISHWAYMFLYWLWKETFLCIEWRIQTKIGIIHRW